MECFYYRGQKCKHCDSVVPVFGLGHHKPKDEGEDQFTKTVINFYEYGNRRERDYLLQNFINLFKERFEGDIQFDAVCVVPTREKDGVNPNMQAFAQEFAVAIGVPYGQAIRRNRAIKGQHELDDKDERLENVRGSIDVAEDVKGKSILVLDNLCISGASAWATFDALREAGAKEVYFMVFGLGSKGRECDFDINPAFPGKASQIVAKWHWPKVSKEKREVYAKEKKDGL